MIKYILNKIGLTSIFAFLSLYLFNKTYNLNKDKKKLNEELENTNQIINKQNKVINVIKNNKSKSISDNIKRMYKGDL